MINHHSNGLRHSAFTALLAGLAGLAGLAVSACSDSTTAPAHFDPPGTYQSALTMLGGTGQGGVSVTPIAVPEAYFTASIKVRLHGAKPNTQYTVQRSPEVNRPLGHDGSCQRALGISPWAPGDTTASAFVTFTQPGTTTAVTLLSSASGDASVDFNFSAPSVAAGTQFDVMFRVLDDLIAPSNLFLSGCFTVTVK